MEQTNLPVVARRIWNIVRVMFFMVRKGISKRKLMVDLNTMMKRGKIAGKAAILNLINHHHHHSNNSASALNHRSHDGQLSFSTPHDEYEFSCSNSPAFPFHLVNFKRKHIPYSHFFACAHPPQTTDDDVVTVEAVQKALEMANGEVGPSFWQSPMVRDMIYSELASPALPGFGRTPAVRQLRITDSPFPLREESGDGHVDEAAEKFILKFYNNLRKQSTMAQREILIN